MQTIISIHHSKYPCQHNLSTVFNILLFVETVTIHQFTAVDMSANFIMSSSRLFGFVLIVWSRVMLFGTPTNDFRVLLTLKPPLVKTFCRSGAYLSS